MTTENEPLDNSANTSSVPAGMFDGIGDDAQATAPVHATTTEPPTTPELSYNEQFTAQQAMQQPYQVAAPQSYEQYYQQPSPDVAALRAELAEARARAAELDRVFAEQQQAAMFTLPSTLEFQHLDREVADELLQKAVRPVITAALSGVKSELDKTKAELEAERKARSEERKYAQAVAEERRRASINERILAAHPDLPSLRTDPAFVQFESTPIGAGSKTVLRDVIVREYAAGNTDYVINVLNQYKQQRAAQAQPTSLAGVATAPVSGGFTASAPAESSKPVYPRDYLSQLNNARATGRLSQSDYKAKLAAYREALKP